MEAVFELDAARSSLEELARQWEGQSAQATLSEAVRAFGDNLVLACSFGPEDIVLIDLLSQVAPNAQVFFIDTGYHFPETLALKERVLARYPQLRLKTVTPLSTVEAQDTEHGERLYERSPDSCCAMRKVEPLNRVLKGYKAWITGMRREQAPTRSDIGLVQWDSRRGMVKFNPLATWTNGEVWKYVIDHKLEYNPLHDQGYPSIGCAPCTVAVAPGQDPRSGRWSGKGKIECGLHT
ncbi:MAG: phosphoadenylyl-sulfate reductase [Anaerolineae bacterium]|nr:phosphoadenylyl-sulfate reductase [Gloeobacterales cyanobacterium ES-bin-313]